MRFSKIAFWLIALFLFVASATKIKIKSIRSLAKVRDEDEDALASLDLKKFYLVLALSPEKGYAKSINLEEFFAGLELLERILTGLPADYLKEMNHLQNVYTTTVENMVELRDVRITLYYHSKFASEFLTESEREALVKTLSSIDLKFQERFCPGISTKSEFTLHNVLWCSSVASSFIQVDRTLLRQITSNPSALLESSAVSEPYFFNAILRAFLFPSGAKRSVKIDLESLLSLVNEKHREVISQCKRVEENSLIHMIAIWNKYEFLKIGEDDFPYKKFLEDFIRLGIFGDVPYLSKFLVKQDPIERTVKGFLGHLVIFKKQVDFHKRRILRLCLPKSIYSDLKEMISMGFELLDTIKSILKEAGYLKRNFTFVNLVLSSFKSDFDCFIKQNETISELSTIKVILPEFSPLSIESSLKAFVNFTFEEARYVDQKLFEIIHLFFHVCKCPTDIEIWNKAYMQSIELPFSAYLNEHPNLNSRYLIGHLQIFSAFLFAMRRPFIINTYCSDTVIIRFGFIASLIGTVESRFDALVKKQLNYEMMRYFSLDQTSLFNTYSFIQYLNETASPAKGK